MPLIAMDVELEQLTQPNQRTFRLTMGLHWLYWGVQLASVALAAWWLKLDLPYGPLLTVILLFGLWNLLMSLLPTLRSDFHHYGAAVLTQLAVGVIAFSGWLYYSGGATSPFVSLFLLPVAIGAMVLRPSGAAALALVCAAAYSMLMFEYVPLTVQHAHGDSGFDFHVFGMWVNFLVSSVVVLVFLSMLANNARKRTSELLSLRERVLRDQQVTAMGGLAASAAHALSTPLSTVAVVLDEVRDAVREGDRQQIDLAREQLMICREHLGLILSSSRVPRLDGAAAHELRAFAESVAQRWRLLHPDSQLSLGNTLPESVAMLDQSVEHSLFTLMDNAAHESMVAGERQIELRARCEGQTIIFEVEDQGSGQLPSLPATTGIASEKANGAGSGLLIVRANMERLGGSIEFSEGISGGVARLRLPNVAVG